MNNLENMFLLRKHRQLQKKRQRVRFKIRIKGGEKYASENWVVSVNITNITKEKKKQKPFTFHRAKKSSNS